MSKKKVVPKDDDDTPLSEESRISLTKSLIELRDEEKDQINFPRYLTKMITIQSTLHNHYRNTS